MNLGEIEKIMSSHEGIHICPICSTPYKPRHSRQKTCGSESCKKAYHADYVKRKNEERMANNPEAVREYNKNVMRRYRKKQRAIDKRVATLDELEDRWKERAERDKRIAEYGDRYGEVSAQKVLETVPKIDVNLGGNDDNTDAEHNDG